MQLGEMAELVDAGINFGHMLLSQTFRGGYILTNPLVINSNKALLSQRHGE